jgi:hypothetical protein
MFVSTAFYDGEQALTKIMTTDDEENESFVCRRKEMTKTVSYISHEGKQNGIQIPVPYNRPNGWVILAIVYLLINILPYL